MISMKFSIFSFPWILVVAVPFCVSGQSCGLPCIECDPVCELPCRSENKPRIYISHLRQAYTSGISQYDGVHFARCQCQTGTSEGTVPKHDGTGYRVTTSYDVYDWFHPGENGYMWIEEDDNIMYYECESDEALVCHISAGNDIAIETYTNMWSTRDLVTKCYSPQSLLRSKLQGSGTNVLNANGEYDQVNAFFLGGEQIYLVIATSADGWKAPAGYGNAVVMTNKEWSSYFCSNSDDFYDAVVDYINGETVCKTFPRTQFAVPKPTTPAPNPLVVSGIPPSPTPVRRPTFPTPGSTSSVTDDDDDEEPEIPTIAVYVVAAAIVLCVIWSAWSCLCKSK